MPITAAWICTAKLHHGATRRYVVCTSGNIKRSGTIHTATHFHWKGQHIKHSEAACDRCLAILEWIPRKTNAWFKILFGWIQNIGVASMVHTWSGWIEIGQYA